MKILGSLIFFVFYLCSAFAAQASLSSTHITLGDEVTLSISANGSSVEFPELQNIASFDILGTSTEQRSEYINGKFSQEMRKNYSFMPTKSITIPPFEVLVDGKKQQTKALRLSVDTTVASNSPFLLEMRIPKTQVMQYEGIPLEFIFKRDVGVDISDLRLQTPKFENFWVKEGLKTKPEIVDGYVIYKMNFFIYPQIAGDFELPPARVDVGMNVKSRDVFDILRNQTKQKSVFSNPLSLHVAPLRGTNLYGDFTLSAQVDKDQINQNEGVNLTLKITGSGNFDDIDAFVLDIPQANIFADKPSVKTFAQDTQMLGEFVQKFSISASDNFIIPPFKLTYFDKKSQKIITKETQPVRIGVKNAQKEKTIAIDAPKKLEDVEQNDTVLTSLIAFALGVFLTLLIVAIVFVTRRKRFVFPKFKDDKDLLKILLKYRARDPKIDAYIELLEENIYAGKTNKIDKKDIKKVIKFYAN